MSRRSGVAVVIIALAMSASPAGATTVPINAPPIAPALGSLQGAVADLANGAVQIAESIKTAASRIVGEIAETLTHVAGPAETYTAAAASAANVEPTQRPTVATYTVRAGDTLSGIAQDFGVSLGAILAANTLTQRAILHPGDRLAIPDPQTAPAAAVTTIAVA